LALGYFFGIGGIAVEPIGTEFYDQSEVMRSWCEQVQSWTGYEMRSLFAEDYKMSIASGSPAAPREAADLSARPDFLHRGFIRQVVHAIGISDILADQGIYPGLLAGTSLGGIVAACLAGSIEREDVFRLLTCIAKLPLAPAGEPARGIAFAVLPPGVDIDWYCGESRPNVYVAADYELSGDTTVLMLSGYLKDLESLATEAPPGHVPVVTGAIGGSHCPLQKFMSDLLEPYLNDIKFHDPKVPLLSGIGGAQSRTGMQLKTGDDVRKGILDNQVEPVGSVKQIIAAFDKHDVQMGLAIGGALPAGIPPSPFPVLQATAPDDIGQIMTMIYDLGIDVGR
jgi:[acyl-carrier-protein] S-malonyltransferase